MQEVSAILFPTDFSEPARRAFRYCLRLAAQYQAKIHLIHVIYPEYEVMDLPVVATQATRAKVNAAKEAMEAFIAWGQAQVAEVNTKPTAITYEIEVGSAVNTILQIAERSSFDLIVMGTRGEHGMLDHTFGSVTTGVLRRAECPVWVIPENADSDEIHIAAYASNLVSADPYFIWKVGKMLEPFNPILHCVHVNTESAIEPVLELAELAGIFEQHAPVLQINFHTLQGQSIPESLEDFADTYDVDLMVLYSPHYSWWEGLFHRSNTRKLALDAKVPLLVIKEKN